MADETFNTLDQYKYASLAQHYAQQENPVGVRKSLEKIVEDLGIADKARPFIQGSFASEEGTAVAAQLCIEQYQKALHGLGMESVYEYFSKDASGYLEGETGEKIKGLFSANKDMTFGDLMEKVNKANVIKKNPSVFSKEEVEGAEKTLKKYELLVNAYATLQQIRDDKLSAGVNKSIYKDNLKEIAKRVDAKA